MFEAKLEAANVIKKLLEGTLEGFSCHVRAT
jgi:hypothetical protein